MTSAARFGYVPADKDGATVTNNKVVSIDPTTLNYDSLQQLILSNSGMY
jgi:hypothetical protein